jgi:ATP/maltotriose-dependent transcriptional regulator MalT
MVSLFRCESIKLFMTNAMIYVDLELGLRRWSDDKSDDSYAVELHVQQADERVAAHSITGSLPRVRFDIGELLALSLDHKVYGKRLTQMLFADPRLQEIFVDARDQAEAAQVPLRLRLRLDVADDAIHSLCWEALQDPERGGLLCASEWLLVSRYLDNRGMLPIRIRPRAELKALVVVANPTDLDQYKLVPIDVAGEVERCSAALADIPTTILAHDYGGRPTLNNIATALRDGPDILYLVCHGTLRDGRPYLWLEGENGRIDRLEGQQFVEMLKRLARRPLLIVLVSCRSAGQAHAAGAVTTLGPQLAAGGVTAVAAMQGDISMETVATFMPTFFRELRRDGCIDRAFAVARGDVLNLPDWWMPVLFLRVRDGMIWSESQITLPPFQRPPKTANFVGREADLGRFTEKLAATHSAFVIGMPGVGKSALAAELASQVTDPDRVFWYSFSESKGISALEWELAGFLARHGQEEPWRIVNHALQSGGQLPKPEVMSRYLTQMVRSHGYLLCFDDFQCVDDPDLKEFAQSLYTATLARELSLIITSWHTPDFVTVPEFELLGGLSRNDAAALLANRDLVLPTELADNLYAYTEGNALFLTLASKALQQTTDPARLIAGLSKTSDIKRYVMKQVHETLSLEERDVMCAVAVLLGYSGTRDAIESILDISGRQEILSELSNSNLIVESEGETDTEYGQHRIVQAFYYDLLGRRKRQMLHQRAGEYYETVEPDPLKAALHFVRADGYTRAAKLATTDVWQFINRGQARELLALLGTFGPDQMNHEQWAAVCTALGEIHVLLGEFDQAHERLQEALRYSTALADDMSQIETQARRYRLLSMVGERSVSSDADYARAEGFCRQGLALAAGLALPNVEIAQLHAQRAEVLWRWAHYDDAERACHAGLAALPAGRPRERGALLQRLATIDAQRGHYDEAIQKSLQSKTWIDQVNDKVLKAAMLNNLGYYLERIGQFDEALQQHRSSLELKEEVGDLVGKVTSLINIGDLHQVQGNYDEALIWLMQSQRLCEQYGLHEPLARTLICIGIVHYVQGRLGLAKADLLGQAGADFERARMIFQDLGDAHGQVDCFYRLGDVALAQRDDTTAYDYGEQALMLARQIPSRAYESCALRVIGEALLALGYIDDAAAHLKESWQIQEEVPDPYDQTLALAALARVTLAQGDTNQATVYVDAGLKLAQEMHLLFQEKLIKTLRSEISNS